MPIKKLEEFVNTKPDSPVPYVALGDKYFESKVYDIAEVYYLQAKDIDNEFRYAYEGLGKTYMEMERFEEAVKCFEKAIEKKSLHFEAYEKLAEIYAVHLDDREKAVELLQTFENNLMDFGDKDKESRLSYYKGLGDIYAQIKELSLIDSCVARYSRLYPEDEFPQLKFIHQYAKFNVLEADTIIYQLEKKYPNNNKIALAKIEYTAGYDMRKGRKEELFYKELDRLAAAPLETQDLRVYRNFCFQSLKKRVNVDMTIVHKKIIDLCTRIINEGVEVNINRKDGEVAIPFKQIISDRIVYELIPGNPRLTMTNFNFDNPSEMLIDTYYILFKANGDKNTRLQYLAEVEKYNPSTQYNMINMAEMYLHLQMSDEANSYYTKAIEVMDNKIRANHDAGLKFYYAKDYRNSLHFLKKAYKMNNQHFKVIESMAKCYMDSDLFDEANQFISSILEPYITDKAIDKRFENIESKMSFRENLNNSKSNASKNDLMKAKRIIVDIYINYMTFLAEKQDNATKAAEYLAYYDKFENLLEDSNKKYYYKRLADICNFLNLKEKRELFISKTLTAKQISEKKLAECKKYEENKEYMKAITCYADLLDANPADKNIQEKILKNINKFGRKKGNFDTAINMLEKLIRDTHDNEFKINSYKSILSFCRQGRINDASYKYYTDKLEATYKKMAEIDSDDIYAKFNLAGFYFGERRYGESKKHLSELVESITAKDMNQESLRLAFKINGILYGLEQYNDLIKLHDIAMDYVYLLESNGYNMLTKNNLSGAITNMRITFSVALYETGEPKKAYKSAKKLYKFMKKHESARPSNYGYERLADLFVKLKKYKLAEEQYLTLLDKVEEDSTYKKIIALYRDKMKDEKKAKEYEDKFKKLRDNRVIK